MTKTCECNFCKAHDKYRWATIMECGCYCHTADGVSGHDSLCCAYPNGLKRNNPHENLGKAETYKMDLKE
jgi:hypothetical protein